MRSPNLRVDGPKLKAAREMAGYTQLELADEIGVSRSAVARWESDRIEDQPTGANFRALLATLNVRAEDILAVPDDQAA